MIRLNEDYGIDVTDTSYNLVRFRISAGEKTKGQETYTPFAYFTSLEGALNCFRREILKDRLKSRSMGITEAISEVLESNREVEEMIKKAVKGL